MTRKQLEERIGADSSEKLRKLEALAFENELLVMVRAIEGSSTGDFTIFIYDKKVKKDYMVGFDGSFKGTISFNYCLAQSFDWIRDYMLKKNLVKTFNL